MFAAVFTILLAVAAPPVPAPFEPVVDDPLLAPVPIAAEQVKSWEEAMGLVRSRSTDERSALAAIEGAEGRAAQALSALLPNARLSASLGVDVLNPSRPPLTGAPAVGADARAPSVPLGSASVSLNQSLFDLGAWRGRDAARAGVRAAEAAAGDVRRRLTQGLARALVSVAAAERVAELHRLGLRQALEREALTRRTMEVGTATELDLVRVRQDVQVARGLVVSGDEQLRRTRDALGLALGLDRDAGLSRDFALGGLVSEAQRSCVAIADVGERPDLAAARAREEAARASRLQALAGYLPSLGLQSTLFGYTTDPAFGQMAAWNVSAVLSVPLWEGGLRAGLVREREAARVQAEEAAERTRRDVSIELARARRGVEVGRELLASATEARALAARTDEMTRRSFEVGRAGSLDLVQSAVALRQADTTLAAREFEWVQARLDAFLTEARCDW